MKRREFLQWSGAGVAAAVALPACGPMTAPLGPPPPAPEADAGGVVEASPDAGPVTDPPAMVEPEPPPAGTIVGEPVPNDDGDRPMLGELRMFAGRFAPRGWAPCDGQLLAIADNMALYALLQTRFGGTGVDTFALPDLRGRVVVGASPALPAGTRGGDATVASIEVAAGTGATVAAAGANAQPDLTTQYLIAVAGVYPARASTE
ncbi:MAG: tail fiber protein [Myxococcales bacterium]|nr:tail fiber protein [Myxococcales bacterium]